VVNDEPVLGIHLRTKRMKVLERRERCYRSLVWLWICYGITARLLRLSHDESSIVLLTLSKLSYSGYAVAGCASSSVHTSCRPNGIS